MMTAYDKVYLEKARVSLGRMLDFAVYDLKYSLEDFFELFVSSGVAGLFGEGDFSVIAGKSGVELAYLVLDRSGVEYQRIKPNYTSSRSEEYWLGWALAYYQWYSCRPFDEIVRLVPISDILALYSPYHEMDIRQFADKMSELCHTVEPQTKLKLMRQRAGLSQSELADISGVPLRTIQQYEQRQKSINKAQAEYLVMLARALCCEVGELMEKI